MRCRCQTRYLDNKSYNAKHLLKIIKGMSLLLGLSFRFFFSFVFTFRLCSLRTNALFLYFYPSLFSNKPFICFFPTIFLLFYNFFHLFLSFKYSDFSFLILILLLSFNLFLNFFSFCFSFFFLPFFLSFNPPSFIVLSCASAECNLLARLITM